MGELETCLASLFGPYNSLICFNSLVVEEQTALPRGPGLVILIRGLIVPLQRYYDHICTENYMVILQICSGGSN